MPPVIIAAGIGATAGIGGAVISSNANKKAVAAQQQTNRENNALATQQYQLNAGNLNPAIERGNTAGGYVSSLLNIGGDPAAAQAAFGKFQDSTGYQFQLQQGLGAVNSNAYARGMGDSGATLKALQDRGNNIAKGSFTDYLGQLQNVSQQGTVAASSLAGVGQNMVNQVSGNNQTLADARGNAAIQNGNSWSNALQSIGNAAGVAYGSSYKPKATPQSGGFGGGGYLPMLQTPYGQMYGGYGGRA